MDSQLCKRSHAAILQRVKALLGKGVLNHGPDTDEELSDWLFGLHAGGNQYFFSFEEDMALCREVIKAWHEERGPCIPSKDWFERNVLGRNKILEKRSSTSLYSRFKNSLAKDLVDAAVLHNERWSFVQINFSWLKKRHGLSAQPTKGSNLPLWLGDTSAFEPFVPSVAEEIAQEPLLKKMRSKILR